MNRRQKGNRNEDRSAEFLNKLGYLTITSRASASPIDIVAVSMAGSSPFPDVILVQSKTNHGYRKSDLEPLRVIAHVLIENKKPARVHLHDWHRYERTPRITSIGLTEEEDFTIEY